MELILLSSVGATALLLRELYEVLRQNWPLRQRRGALRARSSAAFRAGYAGDTITLQVATVIR